MEEEKDSGFSFQPGAPPPARPERPEGAPIHIGSVGSYSLDEEYAPPRPKEPDLGHSTIREKDKRPLNIPTSKSSSSGWLTLVGGILILLLATGVAIYLVRESFIKTASPEATTPENPTAQLSDAPSSEDEETPYVSKSEGESAEDEGDEGNLSPEEFYARSGWKKDAKSVLANFIAANSSAKKLPYILNAHDLKQKVDDFYAGSVIDDSDTPANEFSAWELSKENSKRGLFMMVYDLPPQYNLKEFFRPLAPMEIQYGLEELSLLLSAVGRVENFASEPVHVQAFFKRTPEGLKLDWEVFAQTKYRTLLNFVDSQQVGKAGIFRIFISEDVPDRSAPESSRVYRISDPANLSDAARVYVDANSDVEKSLAQINWRGTNLGQVVVKTATVELKWIGDPKSPRLTISRFLCWEFLGLGGKDGSAEPKETSEPKAKEPAPAPEKPAVQPAPAKPAPQAAPQQEETSGDELQQEETPENDQGEPQEEEEEP